MLNGSKGHLSGKDWETVFKDIERVFGTKNCGGMGCVIQGLLRPYLMDVIQEGFSRQAVPPTGTFINSLCYDFSCLF